jgi:hypothetical protein
MNKLRTLISQAKYYFYPSRWRAVYIYLLRRYLKWLDGSDWTPEIHEIEQYHFRLLACAQCVRDGVCTEPCKCLIPEKIWNRTDECTAGNWGEFMTEEEWENYKSQFGVKFLLIRRLSK